MVGHAKPEKSDRREPSSDKYRGAFYLFHAVRRCRTAEQRVRMGPSGYFRCCRRNANRNANANADWDTKPDANVYADPDPMREYMGRAYRCSLPRGRDVCCKQR